MIKRKTRKKNNIKIYFSLYRIQAVIAIRHKIMNDIILGQGKSCSLVYKVEPSIIYPTSVVN